MIHEKSHLGARAGRCSLGATALRRRWRRRPRLTEIDAVAKELWCPLCNGVRLDNCELQACIQMREVIAQKLAAGESKEQIKAYFVQQYGDVVLGTPSREGFNLVVWIFPILAVMVGLGWLAYLVTTWRKRRPAAPLGAGAPRSQQPMTT